jgi:hypothetical protein
MDEANDGGRADLGERVLGIAKAINQDQSIVGWKTFEADRPRAGRKTESGRDGRQEVTHSGRQILEDVTDRLVARFIDVISVVIADRLRSLPDSPRLGVSSSRLQ